MRHIKTLSVCQALGEYVLDLSVNVVQDLEVEAEAGHQQETGSQPRAWGMMAAMQTHIHFTLHTVHSGFHMILGVNEIAPECFSWWEKLKFLFQFQNEWK